jgi:hypothetical protein
MPDAGGGRLDPLMTVYDPFETFARGHREL